MIKNFWSNKEIQGWYKNDPLLDRIIENEKCWLVLFKNNTFYLCEKDENFIDDSNQTSTAIIPNSKAQTP